MWTAVLCSLLVVLLSRVFWRRWRYDLHKIPAPPGLPLLGHTLDFMQGEALREPTKWFGEALKRLNYPKLIRFEVMGSTRLVITDDKFIKQVMNAHKDPFPRLADGGFILPMIGNDVHAKALVMTPRPTHYVKTLRKIYAEAFKSENLKTAMSKVQEVANKMIAIIESKRTEGPIEVQELFIKMTLDAIGAVAFELNLGGLDGSTNLLSSILAAGYVGRENFLNPAKPIYCKLFPNSGTAQDQRRAVDRLNTEWKRVADEILSRDDPASETGLFWHGLKRLTNPETKNSLTYSSLMAEVATVVIGGMEAIGQQLAWTFSLLASRSDIVEKVLEELKQHGLYGNGSRDLQFDDLAELPYLTAVVKEGMRVAHVLPTSMPREVPKGKNVLGYRVPDGTKIMQIGNWAFHSVPDWNNAETFKPDRWLQEDESCQTQNIMFSTGPRDCIGQKLAMLEMRLITALLLKKYEISLTGTFQDLANNTRTGFVIEAKDGVWLNFTPRNVSL